MRGRRAVSTVRGSKPRGSPPTASGRDEDRLPGEAALPDLGAARVVALGLVASKPAGYLREAMLAARFGTGRAMDAFTIGTTAAQAAWALVGTPLQRVLVPVLVRASQRGGNAALAATTGAVASVALGVSALLGVGLLTLAGPIAGLLAGGGPTAQQVALVLRWLSLLPLAMTLSALATAWLQARQRFTLPAFAPLPVDLAVVAGIVFAAHHGALAAAWGLLVGTALQFLMQWPALRYHGFGLRWPASPGQAWSDAGVRATTAMALPLWVSVGAVQAISLLQQGVAARLGVGDVAALSYASRVLDLPAAVFSLPLVTVALPHFAALRAGGRAERAEQALRESSALLVLTLLPCALWILLLRLPLAAAIFAHGAFGPRAVATTGAALAGFAPLAVGLGLQELLRAYFYSQQDVRTPMIWDLMGLGVAGAVDLTLGVHWGPTGLALGTSVAALTGAAGMGHAAWSRRHGRWAGDAVGGRGLRLLRPLVAGAAALTAVTLLLQGHGPPPVHWRPALLRLVTVGGASALAYVAAVLCTGGGPLLRQLLATARRRLPA